MGLTRVSAWAVAILAFMLAGPAAAEEDLDAGKTGAQLYASNCAICHKTPQTLGRGGLFGLSGFLREHYTASRESAAAIAAYVESISRPTAPPKRTGPVKRTAKGDEKTKPGDKKLGAKPADSKAKEAKPAQTKSEAKPAEAKAAEPKPAEAKTSEPKAGEPKPAATPAAKPDAPKKPD